MNKEQVLKIVEMMSETDAVNLLNGVRANQNDVTGTFDNGMFAQDGGGVTDVNVRHLADVWYVNGKDTCNKK